MTKFNNALIIFYRFMLLIFGVCIISVVWAMSVCFTCFISSDTNEVTFFCKDNVLLNVIFAIAFISLLFILKKVSVYTIFTEKLKDDHFYTKTKTSLLWIIAIMGFLWVTITQYVPGSDQLDVLSSAYKYGVKDTSFVTAGGYLDRWPHNIGIATVERFLALIVGDFNAVFMQALNVPGIILIYKKIVDTWDKLGGSRFSQVCTLACGIIFYPLIMYASFVYGNIWHVTLALIAFDAEVDFFQKKKWRYIIKTALAIGLSYVVKSSAVLFLVALVIFAIIRTAIDRAKLYKLLVLLLAMALSLSFFISVPKKILAKSTGIELRESTGIWALIAMGLQEDGTTAGWYNGYPLTVYYDNNCDGPASEKVAKEEAINRIKFLFSDKHNAYKFFSKKVASTWIEPTYQGYWINQVRTHRVTFPKWLEIFMSAKGYTVAAKIFNFFQIMIFTGVIIWLILEDKKAFVEKSFLLLSFIGGFTFLLFWETKSQYTITYFILLFPYALTGYELMLEKNVRVLAEASKPVLIYSALAVILFIVGYVKDASNCLSNSNEAYYAYVAQWQDPHLNESVYEINYLKADLQTQQEQNAFHIHQVQEEQLWNTYYKSLLDAYEIEYDVR